MCTFLPMEFEMDKAGWASHVMCHDMFECNLSLQQCLWVQQHPWWNVNVLFLARSSEESWKRKLLLQEAVFGAQKSSAAILLGSDTWECCPDTHYSIHPAFYSVFKQKYSFSLACMSAIIYYLHLSFFTDYALLEWIWVSFLMENVQKMKPSGCFLLIFE